LPVILGDLKMFKFVLASITAMFIMVGNVSASQSYVYLVGSITNFNNLSTTSPSKFSMTDHYGPIYFSVLDNCNTAKTLLEGHRAEVIPSSQQGNVIGASKENLIMVSTLQCLPITQ